MMIDYKWSIIPPRVPSWPMHNGVWSGINDGDIILVFVLVWYKSSISHFLVILREFPGYKHIPNNEKKQLVDFLPVNEISHSCCEVKKYTIYNGWQEGYVL